MSCTNTVLVERCFHCSFWTLLYRCLNASCLQKFYLHTRENQLFLFCNGSQKIQEVSYLLLWKTLPPLPPRVGAPLPLAAAVEKRKQHMHLETGVIHNI